MHGFGEQFDWDAFVGTTLDVVSFTSNTVHLVFSGELTVTLQTSGLLKTVPDHEEALGPMAASRIPTVVGEAVSAVTHTAARLELLFDSGCRLTLVDNSSAYESLSVSFGGLEFFV